MILEHLLPQAHAGLEAHGVDVADRDRYLGVIEDRVRCARTGAQWALDSLSAMNRDVQPEVKMRALCASIDAQQWNGSPVHEWALANVSEKADWRENYRNVGQIMTTDLFTVHPDDLVDLAASVMDWEHLRHVPVEDTEGRLVGLITHRHLLRMVSKGHSANGKPLAVREIMRADPVTCSPETNTCEAISLMRDNKVGCLPVVSDGRLVGIVTETDFMDVAAGLLDRWLREE